MHRNSIAQGQWFKIPAVMYKIFLVVLVACLIMSCRKHNEYADKRYVSVFSKDTDGWHVFFSDYPAGEEDFYELSFQHSGLPDPLDNTIKSLKISGNNHSDDLLSLVYRKFAGLKPNKQYAITFDVELASNVATNWFGIGGSPDLSLGAGAIAYPPASTIDEEGLHRPNFSSAIQSHLPNENFEILGTIGVGEDVTEYALIRRNNKNKPLIATANSNGELWVMIGTDSGFEGATTLYYKSIKVNLR